MSALTQDALLEYLSSELTGGQTVAPDDSLLLSGLIDSLGIMGLVSHLEAQTSKRIPLEDIVLEHFDTPRAILTYMERLA
ncbi:MAG: acyl carrier protein [Pseudomonadota bacterium]